MLESDAVAHLVGDDVAEEAVSVGGTEEVAGADGVVLVEDHVAVGREIAVREHVAEPVDGVHADAHVAAGRAAGGGPGGAVRGLARARRRSCAGSRCAGQSLPVVKAGLERAIEVARASLASNVARSCCCWSARCTRPVPVMLMVSGTNDQVITRGRPGSPTSGSQGVAGQRFVGMTSRYAAIASFTAFIFALSSGDRTVPARHTETGASASVAGVERRDGFEATATVAASPARAARVAREGAACLDMMASSACQGPVWAPHGAVRQRNRSRSGSETQTTDICGKRNKRVRESR